MKSIFLCFLLLLSFTTLNAQLLKKDSASYDWNFRVSPYFWFIGLEGTIYRPPEPTNYPIPPPPRFDIDVGFSEIKNSIKFALMLSGQYRGKDIVAQFNLSSLVLESEAITPFELLLQENVLKFVYTAGDLGLGYRIVRNPKFQVDGILGAKFAYFKVDLSTNLVGNVPVEGARSFLWVDPVIGVNLIYRPLDWLEVIGYGDLGGRIINTDLTTQFVTMANFHITPVFYISTGYRYYYVEIPEDKAIYDGSIRGWIAKLGFQF